MSQKKYSLSKQERMERVKALQDQLIDSVANLDQDHEWLRFLDFLSQRHEYSFNNTLLISKQMPQASFVAAKAFWWKHGYKIRKGQKGLAILVPLVVTHASDAPSDNAKAEREEDGTQVYFKVGYVWDVSQMEPCEDRDVTPINRLRTPAGVEDVTGLFDQLAELATASGITVERQAFEGTTNGYFVPATNSIVINAERSPMGQALTLLHETAHSLMHTDIEEYIRHRGVSEVEAESVTYVVAKALQLDVSNYSTTYVAGWAEGDTNVIKDVSANVREAALALLEQLAPLEE